MVGLADGLLVLWKFVNDTLVPTTLCTTKYSIVALLTATLSNLGSQVVVCITSTPNLGYEWTVWDLEDGRCLLARPELEYSNLAVQICLFRF